MKIDLIQYKQGMEKELGFMDPHYRDFFLEQQKATWIIKAKTALNLSLNNLKEKLDQANKKEDLLSLIDQTKAAKEALENRINETNKWVVINAERFDFPYKIIEQYPEIAKMVSDARFLIMASNLSLNRAEKKLEVLETQRLAAITEKERLAAIEAQKAKEEDQARRYKEELAAKEAALQARIENIAISSSSSYAEISKQAAKYQAEIAAKEDILSRQIATMERAEEAQAAKEAALQAQIEALKKAGEDQARGYKEEVAAKEAALQAQIEALKTGGSSIQTAISEQAAKYQAEIEKIQAEATQREAEIQAQIEAIKTQQTITKTPSVPSFAGFKLNTKTILIGLVGGYLLLRRR